MKYALCVKLWQHDFTIVIVVKLLINGLCWDKFNEKWPFVQKLVYTHSNTEREREIEQINLHMISSLQSSGDY